MVYLKDTHNFNQPDFNDKPGLNKKRRLKIFGGIFLLVLISYFVFSITGNSKTIEVQNNTQKTDSLWQKMATLLNIISEPDDPDYLMPLEEKDRFDVLILGVRGENDPDAKDGGALLTDTIIVFSFDRSTKKSSLVSIPRDFYVKIDKNKKEKINSAYEYGYYHKDGGINYSKNLVSKISGVYIDKAVVIDFSSFEKIVDQVGGIDLVLAKPFEEKQQWSYEFFLPAGPNHLNGKDALYYARSRFSSNDFDRARRQQEVILALKNKLTNLNFLSDPVKTLGTLSTVISNIKTDINIWNTKELLNLSKELNSTEKIKKHVFTTDNMVYESRVNEAYILLPKGDNFVQIKQLFQDILK